MGMTKINKSTTAAKDKRRGKEISVVLFHYLLKRQPGNVMFKNEK